MKDVNDILATTKKLGRAFLDQKDFFGGQDGPLASPNRIWNCNYLHLALQKCIDNSDHTKFNSIFVEWKV